MGKNLLKTGKFLSILIFTLCITILSACQQGNRQENTDFDPPFKQGGTRLFYEGTGKLNPNSTIEHIGINETYHGKVTVTNYYPFENDYNLFVFVNYKLVKILSDRESTNTLSIGRLKTGETISKDFEIKGLKEGEHDLLILLVRKQNKPLSKKEFISSTNYLQRYQIIVGSNVSKEHNIKFQPINNIQEEIDFDLPYLTLGSEEQYKNALSYHNTDKDIIKTNLFFNNLKSNMRYSIVVLDNDQQVNKEPLFISIKKKGRVKVELPIKLQKNTNTHNLIVLLIPEPFTKQDDPSENVQGLNKITVTK
jgi:hypothetical protein